MRMCTFTTATARRPQPQSHSHSHTQAEAQPRPSPTHTHAECTPVSTACSLLCQHISSSSTHPSHSCAMHIHSLAPLPGDCASVSHTLSRPPHLRRWSMYMYSLASLPQSLQSPMTPTPSLHSHSWSSHSSLHTCWHTCTMTSYTGASSLQDSEAARS